MSVSQFLGVVQGPWEALSHPHSGLIISTSAFKAVWKLLKLAGSHPFLCHDNMSPYTVSWSWPSLGILHIATSLKSLFSGCQAIHYKEVSLVYDHQLFEQIPLHNSQLWQVPFINSRKHREDRSSKCKLSTKLNSLYFSELIWSRSQRSHSMQIFFW